MAAAPDAHASAARPEGVVPTKAGTLQQWHVFKPYMMVLCQGGCQAWETACSCL